MATYQEQLARRVAEREAREKAEAERKAAQMSPDQIANWRIVLRNMGIPFASVMPDATVQRFRDAFQARINAELPDAAHGNSKGE